MHGLHWDWANTDSGDMERILIPMIGSCWRYGHGGSTAFSNSSGLYIVASGAFKYCFQSSKTCRPVLLYIIAFVNVQVYNVPFSAFLSPNIK